MGVLALTMLGTVFVLAYVSLVGRWIYPALPGQYGGGNPQRVCLVFKPDAAEQVVALGLEPSEGNSVVASVLFDGSDFLVVRRTDDFVVEFDKTLLAGTTHVGAGQTSVGNCNLTDGE
jgi:hypothetical protein